MEIEFQITSDIYKNIFVFSKSGVIDMDCTIHINNQKEIKIPIILACAISSVFSLKISADPTSRDFYVDVDFSNAINDDFYSKLESIFNLEKIILENDEEIQNFAKLGIAIGCESLKLPFKQRCKDIESNLTLENALSSIATKISFNFQSTEYEREIKLLAENFEKKMNDMIEFAKLKDSNEYYNFFSALLQNESLTISNEDVLLDFVLKLSKINKIYELLLNYVYLEYCSVEKIEELIDYALNNISTNENMNALISCFRRRLIQEKIPANPSVFNEKRLHCEFIDDSDPFNGILRRENNKGNVIISASSGQHGNVSDILKGDTNLDFYTSNYENSWISASLKNNKSFIITKYMIRSNRHGNQIKSWKLEGKTKDGNLILLDSNSYDFNALQNKIFTINSKQPIIEVKLTQIGVNSANNYLLRINQFDVFGYLI